MVYTGTYIDENGVGHEISLTEEDSIEALKNDRDALLRRYNTQRVTVRQVKAQEGEAMRFQLTLHAPTHYLTSEDDTEPKPCDEMTCTLVCMPGYPITPMKAGYAPDRHLASPNVGRSGWACIDEWKVGVSSMLTVGDKLLHDMIHDPSVTRYDSVANSDVVAWHKRRRTRRVPHHRAEGALGARNPAAARAPRVVTPPPLPRAARREAERCAMTYTHAGAAHPEAPPAGAEEVPDALH